MMIFILIILAPIATAGALPGLSLDCTNDFDGSISCQFDALNCSEYYVSVRNIYVHEESLCAAKHCTIRSCCCSVELKTILDERLTATVLKGGESVASKIISITTSMKPKVPTIVSVKESNGNFQVVWRTNIQSHFVSESLSATVTYRKKGDTKEVSEFIKPSTYKGQNYYEILGKNLEPSTTYVVSVRSFSMWSNLTSDSSKEFEFKTSPSRKALLLAVIISLSILAAILSGAVYGCYVTLKRKWWDSVGECQSFGHLDIIPRKQEVLKVIPPIISSVCVEPLVPDDSKPWSKESLKYNSTESLQESSGISTGSSSVTYADTEPANIIAGVQDALSKVLINISPISVSPVTTNLLTEVNKVSGLLSSPYNPCGVRADGVNSESSELGNQTGSVITPSGQVMNDVFQNQNQAGMLCDSSYRPCEGDMVTCPDRQAWVCPPPTQQDIILPPAGLSPMQIDMSYQVSSGESAGISLTQEVRSSRISSGREQDSVDDRSNGVTLVDDNYLAFQALVQQPDMLFSDQKGGEEVSEDSSNQSSKSIFNPLYFNGTQGGQFIPTHHGTLLYLIPADQSAPVITDSSYHVM
ncbi:uncharacterized protein ACBR49_004694 [Aulostomus maculatus]